MTHFKTIVSGAVLVCFLALLTSSVIFADQQPVANAKNLINVNSADAQQLDKLPRIGPKMALRIIEYRKTNGNFKRIQDLMKVKGIGPKVFEKLQALITV